MINLREQSRWYAPLVTEMQKYAKKTSPPIRCEEVGLQFLCGKERGAIRSIKLIGDNSFFLTYKTREGAVSSLDTSTTDLLVVQFQGSKQEGYRVTVGLAWVRLMSEQIVLVANRLNTHFKRLALPDFQEINGLDNATIDIETALSRYATFVSIAGLRFSQEEHKYLLDL